MASGTLAEPYTGTTVQFRRGKDSSEAVQIDHVVALGNAWQTGAAALTPVQRQSLANDPSTCWPWTGRPTRTRATSDAASWLPPSKKFRCHYVARQISVKAAYRLWVTPAEKSAMENVLGRCPQQAAWPAATSISEAGAVDRLRSPARGRRYSRLVPISARGRSGWFFSTRRMAQMSLNRARNSPSLRSSTSAPWTVLSVAAASGVVSLARE